MKKIQSTFRPGRNKISGEGVSSLGKKSALLVLAAVWLLPSTASAMHIMEGFLPKEESLFWLLVTLPFMAFGILRINQLVKDHPEKKLILGLAAAFIFVLSALKIPSVSGSCSHPTGVGLAAVLFGPAVSSVLSGIVLVFQALLLAHGGITTWGANNFSMGIAGGLVGWSLFHLIRKLGGSNAIAIFVAASLGDMATYLTTAGQLAWAYPDAVGGFWAAYLKFSGIFVLTQIPLAICEGFLSVVVFSTLNRYSEQGLISLGNEEKCYEKTNS